MSPDSPELRFAAVSALVEFGGKGAIDALRPHVDSADLAFRYQVVNALVSKLGDPLNTDLGLLPILMCRRHNSREWLDSLSLYVKVWAGDKAVPVSAELRRLRRALEPSRNWWITCTT